MFYFGYLFWEWPTSVLLQRLPLAKYSAFNVIMWGLTLCCLAAVKDFAGAMVSMGLRKHRAYLPVKPI